MNWAVSVSIMGFRPERGWALPPLPAVPFPCPSSFSLSSLSGLLPSLLPSFSALLLLLQSPDCCGLSWLALSRRGPSDTAHPG